MRTPAILYINFEVGVSDDKIQDIINDFYKYTFNGLKNIIITSLKEDHS